MHASQRSEGGLAQRHAAALLAKTDDELEACYDSWATLYDADLAILGGGRNTPGVQAAAVLQRHASCSSHPRLVDFGCGTGAAGVVLHAAGWRDLTGCDLSTGMLAQAEARGVYSRLHKARLPESGLDAGAFDAIHAAAMFAPGQAPPAAFDEFVRVLRPGGLACISMRCRYHDEESPAHAEKLRALEASGQWRRVAVTTEPYLPTDGVDAYVFVFEKA